MIKLEVYFIKKHFTNDGTAVLYENLIDNSVVLRLYDGLYIGEIKSLIQQAVNILKTRYKDVKVNINWDSALRQKEEDKDVITSK